jgi:aromatic ring-opening dioxygenase catalytic subunit (LigB family)
MTKSPVLYLSHGGGPLPLLGDARHKEMVRFLREVTPALGRPAATLVVSAHWEERQPTITAGRFPALIYDYHGFPKESYEIEYPAPGDPVLAGRIAELLESSGFEAVMNEHRGFDHGVFVPLKLMYPGADIPCVQLSLLNNMNPEMHIRMGRALMALRNENVLIIGSGFSFHSLRAFFSPQTRELQSLNDAFQQWLIDTCCSREISEAEREQRLIDWHRAPAARVCHPREEHLLPLHVCYGAAASSARQAFRFDIMGIKASAFLW